MSDQHIVSLKGVTPANNQEVILSYIRAAKDIKARSQEEIGCLTQALKDRNSEIRHLKSEAIVAKQNIDKHNSDFQKFRKILTELKFLAVEGRLTSDVVYGPELMSLKKEKDKYEKLYHHEFSNSQKFEARSVAMSAQVIERQKKVFKLEAMLVESETKRLQLESVLLAAERQKNRSVSAANMDTVSKKLKEGIQSFQRMIQTS